jgi:demethylmenaquinone methyltransferase/2-methoxy-6-polyprenyl-1,4-benzoquinol methylase
MHDDDAAILEVEEDVFRAPAHMFDAPSFDALFEARRQLRTQIRAVERKPVDPPPLHAERQAAPDRLDFWQFRHGLYIALAMLARYGGAMAGSETGGEADFGYRRVKAAEKPFLVRQLFDGVASRYDLMNDLMSGGVHRLWKAELIQRLNPRPGQVLIDVAGGTGDIAGRFLDSAGASARAIVCDLTPGMLQQGRARAVDRGLLAGIDWVCGDAEQLPIAAGAVDAYTIAFGLRNVTHIAAALSEARRVLKPGGRFLCLEFGRVELPLLRQIYELYSFTVLPRLGAVVAGDRDAYQYLVESIRRFPPQPELARMIGDAGLEQVSVRNLSGGIAALYSAWRL